MKDLDIEIVSMEEAGIHIDVVEDGSTFEENSLKKAVEIMKVSGETVIADDSGLEIDYLDKKPGVLSARFFGEDTPYAEKNNKILDLLKDVPKEKRTARFVCVIAAAFPNGETITTKGIIEGRIAYEPKGENGFGYDPIFYVPEYNMTTAQMESAVKNKISHRGQALEKMKQQLIVRLEENC
jgi:XTP/dITP diphosphohydrolase